jgi:hypothetical protein
MGEDCLLAGDGVASRRSEHRDGVGTGVFEQGEAVDLLDGHLAHQVVDPEFGEALAHAPGGENWPACYAAFMVAEQIGKDPPS